MKINKKTLARIYFILLLISLKVLIGCYGSKPMMRIGELGTEEKPAALLSKLMPGTFGKLLAERTIQLKMVFDDLKGPGVGGPGGGLSLLTASATLMDSTLVKVGLEEFEKLSEMSKEEIADYEKTYRQEFKTDDYHFVWLQLQTPYTEEILDLDRWNIWLEDNNGNKYNPAELVEYPLENINELPFSFSDPAIRDSISKDFKQWKITSKTILLFFSKTNIVGEKIIDENTKTITLTLLDWNNRSVRNEGIWNLKSFSHSKENM